jgi:hypothetical protein
VNLTGQQRRAALSLKAQRPMCVPGTDKPIRAAEGQAWHDLVVRAIQREQVSTAAIAVFCEIAGVDGAECATVGSALDNALVALARSKLQKRCELCDQKLPLDHLHAICDSCARDGKLP